jgi:uncharacterized protein (DUF305 family)
MALDMSLCVLTHSHVPEVQTLIESIRRFRDVRLEICSFEDWQRIEHV